MPDKYKRDLSIEVVVGLFMFTILIALGIFTIVLSRQNFLQKKYPLKVVFEEVGGLREGDRVYLRGTQVGTVKSTFLDNNHVIVTSDLDVPVNFRRGYKVEVVDSSMLGGKMMKIFEGPLKAEPLPENERILGELPVNILEELGVAVAGVRRLSDDVAAGKGTLGKLIKDEEMYDQISGMMKSLNAVSARLENGEGTLGRLLSGDDQLYVDLQAAAANIRNITERIEQKQGALGQLLAEDSKIYADIEASVANIREVTEKINSGEGTLGKLIDDDSVYAEAEKLMTELRAAIDDMRETSPVTTFSSVFFGAF